MNVEKGYNSLILVYDMSGNLAGGYGAEEAFIHDFSPLGEWL